MMRVLLINPICYDSLDNFMRDAKKNKINADEPLGLMYISSYVKKQLPNVDIEVYDWHYDACRSIRLCEPFMGIDPKKLLSDHLRLTKPNIIGLSGLYEYNKELFHLAAKIIKETLPDCELVAGGIYPSTCELNDNNIDYIIKGEGEMKFLDYLKGNITQEDYITNLNELPLPDRSNIDIGFYSINTRTFIDRFYNPNMKVAAIQASRGCPFRCTYCSGHVITNRDYRRRSIESIVDEIKMLKDKYQIEVFIFNEENANVNLKWCKELYRALIPLNIKWAHGGGFYVDNMDLEMIDLAITSGLILFNLAIESGVKETLRRVRKSERIVDCAKNVIDMIRQVDSSIYITSFFLGGFPFESVEDVQKTIDFSLSLDTDWNFYNIYQPFIGSELYQECIEKNLIQQSDIGGHYIESRLKIDPRISKMFYDANIQHNFTNNRRLRVKDYKQTERDFNHVLSIVPTHEAALKGLEIIKGAKE